MSCAGTTSAGQNGGMGEDGSEPLSRLNGQEIRNQRAERFLAIGRNLA